MNRGIHDLSVLQSKHLKKTTHLCLHRATSCWGTYRCPARSGSSSSSRTSKDGRQNKGQNLIMSLLDRRSNLPNLPPSRHETLCRWRSFLQKRCNIKMWRESHTCQKTVGFWHSLKRNILRILVNINSVHKVSKMLSYLE